MHARAERLHSWARNKSSDVQLTGAHVPLTAEQVAVIEGRRREGKDSLHSPVPLGKEVVRTEQMRVTMIDRYLFMDDTKKVKVYIEIEGIGAIAGQVSCEFEREALDLVIQDDETSQRRLCVDDLQCPIDPAKSKITVKPNKIIVSLHKEVVSTWYKLRK